MKTIVYMGSKEIGYECLEYLFSKLNDFNANIIGVLTNKKGDRIKDFCRLHNIELIDGLQKFINFINPDFIISIQYHEILKKEHINKARKIAVNLHMAPLPEYRGCNQFSYAILNKDKYFGTTIHQLEEGIDSGAIIAEKRFIIPKNCWVNELYELTYKKSIELFKENIGNIINGNFELMPQNFYKEKRNFSIHYRKEIERLKVIDLNWSKEKIERHIRATSMPGFEPPYTVINGEKIYFIREEKFNNDSIC